MAFAHQIGLAVGVAVTCLSCPALAETVPLRWAIEQLVAKGVPIVYSSDLVSDEVEVDLHEIDLPALEAAMRSAGLILQREKGVYIVARLSVAPLAPAFAAEPNSQEVHERLETMIVTGTRHRFSRAARTGSLSTFSGEDLRVAPSLGGDAMRVTTRLPGMSSVGVSAKPQIRGGLPDETLVRIDGVELFDAYHLADFQSFFSVVDDRTVDAVDVYTGGFPARYGKRMSGVMDISTRERQTEDRTELGLSAISIFANTSGQLKSGSTRYVASLRHGNLKYLTDRIDRPIGTPRYYDAYGQLSHRTPGGSLLTAGTLLTKDDVSVVDDLETGASNIENGYLWFRVERPLGRRLNSDSLLTVSWSDRRLELRAPAEEPGEFDGFLDQDQSVEKYNFRSDVRYETTGSLLEFGLEAEWAESSYDSAAFVDRRDLGQLLYGDRFAGHDIVARPQGWSGGAYGSGEFEVADGFYLLPGLRWDLQDYYDFGATDHLSPRMGVRYEPTPELSLRLDAGRYYQPEAIYEMQVADGLSTFAKPQRSDHYILGLEWLRVGDWELRLDLYLKKYARTKQRFENLFNPFVMLPELEADRVALTPRDARARGLDMELRKHWTVGLSSVVRYSYMDAEDRFDNGWVPRRWSQRHTVNATVAWRRESFAVAAAITWHSGWRGATPPPEVVAGETVVVEEILNNTGLEDYISLDVSASRTWHLERAALTVFADITNVMNRRNVAGIDWDAHEEDGVYDFERSTDLLLPLIPSAGIVIAF